ncbi:hypothetical protein D6C89_09893 [Aureobasidium pullulans]|uniref:Uncharacterized protein n=1 Tax=Aureobasidium pullulans TaxID=5580 RepID=A0A4S9SV90_AURPU|nr:hypothetical protein D6D20_10202 [Aureobasidium pullulans]THZ15066.1 hypothetical protein D6C89_09893 [Aureobasidium pullulans]
MFSLHFRHASNPQKRSSSQFKIMPDTQNINAWMGYCGGTDPYCQQGCTSTCGNYTYMTGIENARGNESANEIVEKTGIGEQKAEINQSRVGQRPVQEAMRKVQEGPVPAKTQGLLSLHRELLQSRGPTTTGARSTDAAAIVAASSTVAASDEKKISNASRLQNMASSTIAHVIADGDDGDAED